MLEAVQRGAGRDVDFLSRDLTFFSWITMRAVSLRQFSDVIVNRTVVGIQNACW